MDYEAIIKASMTGTKGVIAVAAAADDYVLRAVEEAAKLGVVTPILCGSEKEIKAVADKHGINIAGMEICDAKDDHEAAACAVKLVRDGRASTLMKGQIHTAELFHAVLDREKGLRKEKVLSHVAIIHNAYLNRMFMMSDSAVVPAPTVEQKVSILNNAVIAAHGMGLAVPKVALLAAVETVTDKMPATVEAAEIKAMYERGEITGCVVDGPLAMDLALSIDACEHKGFVSEVGGRADVMIFHCIEAANNTIKVLTNACEGLFGGVVMGAAAPIVLTSRSDSDRSKLYSIICAARIAASMK